MTEPKRIIRLVPGLLLVALLGAAVLVRLAPTDPAAWHVDPTTITKPDKPNHWLLAMGGDAPPMALALPPGQAAARLDAIALATPRTVRLAGQGAHVTYVTRSALWGFPDYTSVKITPTATGSQLSFFARARFGRSDMGVNRARLEDWLHQLAL
ncbi:MAG: DUF1499 domain-containing protein [Pseudorhodobacter sp.]|nr:DUF1499 domain-containing protein [Pseudorhodobacter sp.]